MDKLEYLIDVNKANMTIRDFLLGYHLGKEKIYFYEVNKAFFVNDENVNEWYKLSQGDKLSISIKENIDIAPIPSTLDIVYEDSNYLIVNKPRGVLVHEDGNSEKITLRHMVSNYYKNKRIKRNVRICNRLDVMTEGLIIIAKDDVSEAYMNYLISERKIEKRYYAVCYNKFKNKEGAISLPIGKNIHKNNQMIIYKKGKEAITEYKVIKNGKISLLDINLITGRTHQIRVHLSYLNHPLCGDNIYGTEDGYELGLQSYYIEFFNPFSEKNVKVELALSDTLRDILK